MNQLFKKNFRAAVLVTAFCFATALIASPAYSRGGRHHFPRHHHGSHHVRIFPDAGVLPALLATGIIAGITFSLIESAANPPVSEYRMARAYTPVVVPGPRAPIVSPRHEGGIFDSPVMVTAQMLNVRKGPGLEEPTIRQIPYGTVLSIHGSSPGWYYVSLPGNQHGWVMIQYTMPLEYSGAG